MNFVQDKLKEWGLSYMQDIYEENEIDIDNFLLLGKEEIKELFPKVGPRIRFMRSLEALKNEGKEMKENKMVSNQCIFITVAVTVTVAVPFLLYVCFSSDPFKMAHVVPLIKKSKLNHNDLAKDPSVFSFQQCTECTDHCKIPAVGGKGNLTIVEESSSVMDLSCNWENIYVNSSGIYQRSEGPGRELKLQFELINNSKNGVIHCMSGDQKWTFIAECVNS